MRSLKSRGRPTARLESTSRRFKATTDSKHKLPVSKNSLKRNFRAEEPDRVWVSDITYVETNEGWFYLAVFIDLYSRLVVGWSMSDRINSDLVVAAFRMAAERRGISGPDLVHSDRGSQYASELFRTELAEGTCQSMSRKGDCWDNAVAESFFSSIKLEMIFQNKFKTRRDSQLAIFDYIEIFLNRRRLHSTLGYLPPELFELKGKKRSRAALP